MAFTKADVRRLTGNPVEFFNDAAICSVSSSIYTPTVQDRPDDLTLVESNPSTAFRSENGREAPVRMFSLQMAKTSEQKAVSFKAYIVTYEQGATRMTVLGPDADLCFTANMNGCTFGIGSQANAGDAVTVTHGNAAGQKGVAGLDTRRTFGDYQVGSGSAAAVGGGASRAIQYSLQYTQARDALGVGARVFEPEHYRTGGTNRQSITFGWRPRGQKWGFYFLAYERPGGGKIVTYGVKPVGTNQIQAPP